MKKNIGRDSKFKLKKKGPTLDKKVKVDPDQELELSFPVFSKDSVIKINLDQRMTVLLI